MDVYAHLSARRSLDRPETAARVALSRRKPPAECPRYLASLKRAFWEEYPPFATDLYEEMYGQASSNGQWLAISLITQAQREGDKAKQLWALATSSSGNPKEQKLLKRHACDESRHARAYLKLLDLVFPDSVDAAFRSELKEFSPGFSMNQTLPSVNSEQQASLNDYLNLNIDELRTIIHQVFQLRAISNHCAADNLPKAESTLNKLLDDELNHIADTAEIIERQMMDYPAADLQDFFCKAVRDFDRAKSEEPIDYTYNQRFGNYP